MAHPGASSPPRRESPSMAKPLPGLPPHYDGRVIAIDESVRLSRRTRDAGRALVAALRCVATALVRAASALLAAAGAEAALLLGADPCGMLPRERARQSAPAPLARVIEPPDLHAVIGELLYPGHPGAVVRFTEAMVGTDVMANYPWSRNHGWAASN